MLKLFIFIIWAVYSFALTVSYDDILKAPKSYEKDFYIYLYLKQNPSKEKAKELFSQVKRFNSRLKKEFKKYGLEHKKRSYNFKKPKECFSIKEFTKLPPYKFLKTFKRLTTWHIEKYLDEKIDKRYMQKIAHYKLFDSFAKKVLKTKAKRLKSSLKGIKSLNTKAESSFYLALMNLDNKYLSTFYLKQAKRHAISQFKKDRATLWLYLVTKDRYYLNMLANSKEINIYSLYACEKTGREYKNVITTIKGKNQLPSWNYLSPLAWAEKKKYIYKKLKKLKYISKINYLKREFQTKEDIPYLTYFLHDITYKNYFITYHKEYLKRYNKKRQALILAIARQESKFVPTAISPSFAVGLMQFMPFLANHIAKKIKMKNFDLEDMFKAEIAYKFANLHLNYLEKHLHHPLLIAYAYNGGIGYTKRKILKNKNYFTKGRFEPFYSLETIRPEQPMHYAKKVLANYVIYAHLLGVKDVKLTNLLKELKDIKKIHGF